MSPRLRARNLFEHMCSICERPGMFAPGFTLDHFHLFITGYDTALVDAGLPSQHRPFKEWIYRQHPQWRQSSEWWAKHLLRANAEDLHKTLDEILRLVDQFLSTDGAEFRASNKS